MPFNPQIKPQKLSSCLCGMAGCDCKEHLLEHHLFIFLSHSSSSVSALSMTRRRSKSYRAVLRGCGSRSESLRVRAGSGRGGKALGRRCPEAVGVKGLGAWQVTPLAPHHWAPRSHRQGEPTLGSGLSREVWSQLGTRTAIPTPEPHGGVCVCACEHVCVHVCVHRKG